MPNELVIASATDAQEIVNAAAGNDEAAARVSAPRPEVEKLDGSSVVSVEHPRSERHMLLERLAQHNADLEALTGPETDSERVTSTETEGEPGEQGSENIDIEAVRTAATQDAIAAARRQQQERDSYYQQTQAQHFSNPQAEIEALRAELLPTFQQKVKVLIANADPAQFQEAATIPLSEKLLDCLLTLPGGAESTVFLMRNPQEVRKLSGLPEHMAVAHIAQLSGRLNPAAQRRVSSAPAPIRPIGGSATTSAVPIDEADFQTYKREREKQIKARRR